MYVHGAVLPVKAAAPHAVHDPVARERRAGMLQQQTEERKFLVRERYVLSGYAHDVLVPADVQLAHGMIGRRRRAGTAQQCPHTRQKLHHAEGLGDIVIRPGVQPDHAVVLGVLCREHHNRQLPPKRRAAQLSEHREAVLLRQHDVEQHQLRRLPFHRRPERRGTFKPRGFISCVLERICHELPDALVVFEKIDHFSRLPFLRTAPGFL